MSLIKWTCTLAVGIALAVGATSQAAPPGLDQTGKADLKSAGPLAFGPEGVLFVADPMGAAVFAIEVPKAKPVEGKTGEFKVAGVDAKIAALLGTAAGDILINDLAVQPGSNLAYLSVSRGKGPDGAPALVTVDSQGAVALVGLDKVAYAKVALANAPAADAKDKRGNSVRTESITDMAYVDGRVLVAGLSNEEFASKLRAFRFPFGKEDGDTSVEIYHGAHGAFETRAPVRTFVPLIVAGEPQILAAYTCTPLVRFPLADLKPGTKVRGTTIAELGNRNRPLDIVSYEKDGKTYLLIANSARGVMKVTTENMSEQKGITEKVADKAGLSYTTIESLKGVEHLDKLGADQALLLVRGNSGANLESIALP
jgi:hypothetical protein